MSGGAKVEITSITNNLIRAYNNGTLTPSQFYTEDCQLLIPGRQPVHGHKGMEGLFDRNIQQLVVYDEIGPEDATDLAFSRGSFILYTKKEEIVSSGRFVSIWKKVDGKWLIHRDIPMTDNKFKREDFKELLATERQAVDSFNHKTFNPVKFCTKDSVLMPISKEIVRGYKGIKGIYEKHRFNSSLNQITAVESIALDKSQDYAICRGYFLLHNGQWEGVRSGRFSTIWKRVNGQWQLFRDFPDIDQYRLAKTLENDHKGVRAAGIRLLSAYNSGEVEPSEFYTSDCRLIPPRGEACVDYDTLSQVLKKNRDNNDSRRRVIGVAHEIITNSEETFAYEKGHYMNYSRDGEILSGGEYVTLWKKVDSKWLIYRDIPHLYYTRDQWKPDIFEEIKTAADKIVEAYNSGEFKVSDFYTKDCVIALPGQKLSGHKAVEGVYNHSAESKQVQVQVVDEIGPLTATNLCYIKGMYSVQTALGEVAHSGRYECILKKVDGRWLNCRDMPK